MTARSLARRIAATLAGFVALPALAHVGATAAPHLHDSDGWGVLAVAALTALAAWLDRRRR